jgi:hypothetical protein
VVGRLAYIQLIGGSNPSASTHFWSLGQSVTTPPCHGGRTGSTPPGRTKNQFDTSFLVSYSFRMDSENTESVAKESETLCTACGKTPSTTFGLCGECLAEQVRLSNEIIAEIIEEEKGEVVS